MLKERKDIITRTYEYGEWMIDIVENQELYDVYLYHPEYGIKDHMFGLLKSQELPAGKMDLKMALDLVEGNLENQPYIEHYIEDYAPELSEDDAL